MRCVYRGRGGDWAGRKRGIRGEDVASAGGFVIVHRLRLFCGRGEKRVEEEANERRDGGGRRKRRGRSRWENKTGRQETSVSDGGAEAGRLSARYKN